MLNALCTCSRGFWQHENPKALPIHFLWIIRISRAYSFLLWKRAWLKFFWIIFKIKFKSFHERWSSLVGDMKHNLRGNMKIISINILAYRCLWNNKQQKTKMLIPKRKFMRKYKIDVHSSDDNPSLKAKRNILIQWKVEWPGRWRNIPRNQLLIALYQHPLFALYLFPTPHTSLFSYKQKNQQKNKYLSFSSSKSHHQVNRSNIFFFFRQLTFYLSQDGTRNAGLDNSTTKRSEESQLKSRLSVC